MILLTFQATNKWDLWACSDGDHPDEARLGGGIRNHWPSDGSGASSSLSCRFPLTKHVVVAVAAAAVVVAEMVVLVVVVVAGV